MENHRPPIWTKDFVIILFVNFFIFLSFQMTLPTLPLFVQEIGLDNRFVGLVVGIFTFSALFSRPLAGKWLDTKGRKLVFLSGLTILVVSLYSLSISTILFLLLLVRIVQGVGWGFTTTSTGTIATDLVPPERRGEGLGFFGVSGNMALAMGPALGLFLVDHISFRLLFIICGSFTLLALILSTQIKYVKPDKEQLPNTVYNKFDVFEKSAVPASVLLMFITFTFGGIASYLPAYTLELGFPTYSVQIYFVIYALALLSTRLFAGRLFDSRGMAIVFVPGVFLIMVAMIILTLMHIPGLLYIAAVLYGFGFGMVQPALQAMAVQRAEINRRGMANATFFSFFDLGVGFGALIFGFVANSLGYMYIYSFSAISVIVAFIIFLLFYSRDKKQVSK